jgi:beta-ureidopropionase / N-carbamoyl-L-amino-acid hydrolase
MSLGALRVNGQRLRSDLERMAEIGAMPAGGVRRLALTDEDKRARDVLVSWLKELGLGVSVDEMGNIFGRRSGRNDGLRPVLTGSHVDSQPNGGRFDGILGVLGALEVLRTLEEHGVETERPVVLADWTNEEGVRFAPSKLGSGVWAGKIERDWAWRRTDADAMVLVDELERIGYRGALPCVGWPFHAYYELHIEQGPLLERSGQAIGVPKGIVCLHVYSVFVDGQANQVGPTPMEERRDALVAAAEMILKVRELPAKMGGDMVATVGKLQNYPNSSNTVPHRVHFTVDIRAWDDDLALRSWDDVKADFESIAAKRRCPIRIEEPWRVPHTEFDPSLVRRVESTAEALGYSTLPMVSGAGHDTTYLSTAGPAAMIFVPSVGGRSHVEVENTSWEDCEAGANVLLNCVVKSASEGGT